jgi:hypothetical protein
VILCGCEIFVNCNFWTKLIHPLWVLFGYIGQISPTKLINKQTQKFFQLLP